MNTQQATQHLVNECHAANAKWWQDLDTGEDLRGKRNVPELLMLIVSEVAEAMEGHRKNLMDDKLPHRPMVEVELADAVIRIADLAGGMGYDLAGALAEKMEYNAKPCPLCLPKLRDASIRVRGVQEALRSAAQRSKSVQRGL